MLHLSSHCRYFLCRDPTDMRKGFDSLSGLVTGHMQRDVRSGDVFVFVNRGRTHVKLLLWEGDGFGLYYKRLERGTYELPRTAQQGPSAPVTAEQLSLILRGISLKFIRKRKRYQQLVPSC
jgi:transposase